MHVLNRCWGLLLWMYLLTTVCAQDCTLEEFKQASFFDDNFDTSRLKQSYASGDNVRVHCKVGFRGFFRIICSRGVWVRQGEKCIPISCGHPGDVPFADFALVKGTDYVFGSQVQYTCHRGYQMTSYTDTRNCLHGGWDGHLPVCEPISCQALRVNENIMVYGEIDHPTSGTVLQFSCKNRGHVIVGPAQIVCDETGQWNHDVPTCQIISCSEPPLNHFRITSKNDVYREGDTLTYTCDENYTKADGRPSKCEKMGQSAQWIPMPNCEPITCKVNADPPLGTTYNPQDRIIFTPGESVTVTCGEKLWVKSTELQTAQLFCKSTGRTGIWDFNPVCQLVKCLKDDPLVYRWERIRERYYPYYYRTSADIDETSWYECQRGLEAVAKDSRARCTRRGWEPNPLCEERKCLKPLYKNAEINDFFQHEKYSNGADVSFKCTYEERTFYVRCNRGKWENRDRPCKGQPCATQPSVENGEMRQVSRRTYEDGASVWFRCIGQTDDFKVTCDSGQWKRDKSCEDIPCKKPPEIKNAEMEEAPKQQYEHGQVVTFSCSTGLKESFQVSCQSGEWINNHECPGPIGCTGSEILNGYSHEYNNTLYYTCFPEYKLLGKGWWDVASCVDGKWNTQECVAKTDCGPVPDIPNMNVTYRNQKFTNGFTILIECEAGYHNPLTDLKVLTCKEGKWSLNKEDKVDFKSICIPIAKTCRPPPKVKNALVLAPFEKEYLSGTMLEYKCRDNYVMEGNGIIRCNNGKWEQESISCNEPQGTQSGD